MNMMNYEKATLYTTHYILGRYNGTRVFYEKFELQIYWTEVNK